MSPRQLLSNLETLGSISPKVLAKLRAEIENPDKNVKTKAILSYLVKKGELTKKQAIELKNRPDETSQVASAVEPLVASASGSRSTSTPSEDSASLIDIAPAPIETPEVIQPEPIDSVEPELVDVIEPEVDDVPSVEVETNQQLIVVNPAAEPEPIEVDPIQPNDPFGAADQGGFAEGFGNDNDFGPTEYATETPSGENPKSFGFAGKKDSSDQWATKWLYIGFGLLGLLLIMIAVLYLANIGQKPEDMFKAAMDSYQESSYADATKKFEDYLELFPNEKDSKTARALRVNSILRTTYNSKNWSEVIQQANTLLPELEAEEDNKLDKIRADLGVLLPNSLEAITEVAKKKQNLDEMVSELKTIEEYKKTIDNPVYIPGSVRKVSSIANTLATIDNNVRTIKGQIKKENEYNATISKIEALEKAGKTEEAFNAYNRLIRNYGDLAGRVRIRELMMQVSRREIELVKAVDLKIDTFDAAKPTPIIASQILGSRSGAPVDGLKGEVVSVLADGAVYGIDAGQGTIPWRYFVGYQTTIQPFRLNDRVDIICSQRTHEIMAIDRTSGEIRWRSEIGEPFVAPTMGERMLVVTTKSGKLIKLDSDTGKSITSIQLPQTEANCSAAIATRDPVVYQTGLYHNIYVLNSQDLSCKEVFYLGHYKGSISVRPQTWSGYLLVAVNGGDYCDLHVLKPQKQGEDLKLVQSFSRITNGTVSVPFERFGRLMLMTSDNGEMRVLEINPVDENNPVRVFANDRFETKGGSRSYFYTEGSNLWVAGQGFIRYRIRRNEGKFSREIITEGTDTFVSQLHKLDEYVLHVRRRLGSGMLSASLSDAKTLKPVWRTDFSGAMASGPFRIGDQIVAVSNQGDLFSLENYDSNQRFVDASSKASTVVQDLQFDKSVSVGEDSFVCLGPPDRSDFVVTDAESKEVELKGLTPPADKPACQPISVGGDLIVPAITGQVARVNAKNGRLIGAPFQPPTKPGVSTPWLEPVPISDSLFAIARGSGESPSMIYLLDISNRRSIREIKSLDYNSSPFKSRLVYTGQNIFAVCSNNENSDKLVSINP
ncbi:MAG: PQQ-binding-like beta-propeller repeat protein, partial [Planctomycetota bacterium]